MTTASNTQRALLEIIPSESLPRFPLDDDSQPFAFSEDRADLERTVEWRPPAQLRNVSPDDLCEIGVQTTAASSRPLWNIRAVWPQRAALPTVSIRERHPRLFLHLVPVAASIAAFVTTLVLAFVLRGPLEHLFGALLGHP